MPLSWYYRSRYSLRGILSHLSAFTPFHLLSLTIAGTLTWRCLGLVRVGIGMGVGVRIGVGAIRAALLGGIIVVLPPVLLLLLLLLLLDMALLALLLAQ